MNFKLMKFLIIVSCLLFCISAVSAEDNATFTDLQKIIDDDTTGEISLDSNYISNSSTSVITVSKELTINGNGHTIDANNNAKVFSITGSNVVLNNLTIINVNSQGLLSNSISWSGSNGHLINCNIENNTVSGTMSQLIFWSGSNGTVENTSFINNHIVSTNTGVSFTGPVYLTGANATVKNSYFENNSGLYGGAIYSNALNLVVYNSTFINNTGNWYGGAIYVTRANAKISRSYFESNKASFNGGAIYWFSQSDAGEIDSSIFLDNTAPWGNSIAVGSGSVLTITNSAFLSNTDNNTVVVNSTGGSAIANQNWWGNTADNLTVAPNVYGNITVDNWLYLNVTASPTDIYEGKNSTILFDLTHVSDGDGNTVEVESYDLPQSDIQILDVTGGSVNQTTIEFSNGVGEVQYEASEVGNGSLTLNVFGLVFDFDFTIKESTLEVIAEDVTEGDNATIIIKLPSDATGNVTVTVSNDTYNETFNVELINGTNKLSITDLSIGTYTVNATYPGDDLNPKSNATITFNVNKKAEYILTADNLTKYYHGAEKFRANLTDGDGNPIVNATVLFLINGRPYNRTTDENGTASIAINLNAGTYTINSTYGNITLSNTVTVKSTINATDITKVYRNATQYYATFIDTEGNYLPDGTNVSFNINGVYYTRQINGSRGLARLNINLNPSTYIITAINPINNDRIANNITVLATIRNNTDLVKYIRNESQYVVTAYNKNGTIAGPNQTVTFNINGVLYKRQTNESGQAKLNINLNQGDYIITASYDGCLVSNSITVLPTLNATDLTKKYGESDPFVVHLVDLQGNILSNATVSFNINGVFYNRTTDSDGDARLNINLIPSEYIITSTYDKCSISNRITITG